MPADDGPLPSIERKVLDGYADDVGWLRVRVFGIPIQRQSGTHDASLGGIGMPTRAEVYWDLPEGQFVY